MQINFQKGLKHYCRHGYVRIISMAYSFFHFLPLDIRYINSPSHDGNRIRIELVENLNQTDAISRYMALPSPPHLQGATVRVNDSGLG